MKHFFLFIIILFCNQFIFAQETFSVNGTHHKIHNYYAFTNATIYVDYQTKIENGTLLIKDGKIEAVDLKTKIKIPANAIIYDLKNKFIYPSLIDIYSDYGIPVNRLKETPHREGSQFETTTKGAFNWNQSIRPEVEAGKLFVVDETKAEELRKLGFGVVLTHQQDGIMRGTSALVTLANDLANSVMITDKVACQLSFNKGSSTQEYPGSLMGMIALIRQTYYDVDWLFNNPKVEEYNISLNTIMENWKLPQIFEANDKFNILRADKIGDEFETQYIFKTNGNEYQRIKEVKATQGKLIIPVNFPEAYEVSDPYNSLIIPYSDVKNWELAPYNLGIVANNQIDFSITTSDLKDKKEFFNNIRKAIKCGLSEQTALKALTYSPANFINEYDKIGSLAQGKLANFIITSENLFAEKSIIHENWIKGKQHIINDYAIIDARGNYSLNVQGKIYTLTVQGEPQKLTGNITVIGAKENKPDTNKISVTISVEENSISLHFNPKDDYQKGTIRLSGTISSNGGIWDGNGQLANGEWIKWSAIKGKNTDVDKKKEEKKDSLIVPQIQYPNMAFGFDSLPKAETMIIRGATVWTNEAEGILQNTDVLIQNGKIAAIGKNLTVEGAKIIEGKGKHLSAGIIDEHSHIAISGGVNECTQVVTAEVSIADVVNSDDINIYRQLAGGVTTSQLLHGSCNPIGGQSAIIKLKWGNAPDDMKINDSIRFIKFALGENVKHSNFGDNYNQRFPQTRMGVEQVYYDVFIRANEYQKKWDAYALVPEKLKENAPAPRIDLELETINEILNKERFITCHSYVQSEINMLMHVADSMGFTVNTFTHILEGYKLADKMKKHGAGASTFSDWWAYKFEVNDAIPYNGAIMHQQGITVAYNSDDAEMGRRLNQEAAKAVKYGRVSEEEALKFVTLNPAKLLHLDDKIGSIKIGKDADVVLWSANPLSIYARVEKTIIDGTVYFDKEVDFKLQMANRKEKARIIEKMMDAKKDGEKTQTPSSKKPKLYHCDTVGE
ncbi:MAG: amidohydrolase [Flavobacteriales bacterium CG_4_10_14_0_2_um_filter_32_8]|nr:MAG: amidohydrolase [Flavobacteriales bacterium CG_4_10_14_0_2_um_filter_32_8]